MRLVVALLVALVVGCSAKPDGFHPVGGKISVQGAPIPLGVYRALATARVGEVANLP